MINNSKNANIKKILLTYLPTLNKKEDNNKNKLLNRNLPPNDLMYLASIAKNCGLEANIRDYNLSGDLLKDIIDYQPDYILANITTASFLSDMKTLANIKIKNPNIKIIVKGAPFFAYNANVIYENPFIDYVIYNESEIALKEILENTPENEILGICYKKNFQCLKNENRQFNENLDDLPFPNRELIDNSIYKNPFNKKTQALINISKGCPYNCFFCLTTQLSGQKIRIRSIENIILEIKECIEKYNISDFYFYADIFNFDNLWLIEFCNKIIEEKLKVTWMADFLPQKIDKNLAKILYKSGCRYANLGIESGSVEILNQIGKKISLEEVKNIIKILKENKIKIIGSFIIGLPWDTEDSINSTINFAIKNNIDYANFYSAAPIPGSKFFGYAMIKHLADNNLDFNNMYLNPIIRSHKLSKEKIAQLIEKANNEFNICHKITFKNPLIVILNQILKIHKILAFKIYLL